MHVRFDDGFFVKITTGDGHTFRLGSFGCYIGRPYRGWLSGNGDFDFTDHWKLFAGLFGIPELGE